MFLCCVYVTVSFFCISGHASGWCMTTVFSLTCCVFFATFCVPLTLSVLLMFLCTFFMVLLAHCAALLVLSCNVIERLLFFTCKLITTWFGVVDPQLSTVMILKKVTTSLVLDRRASSMWNTVCTKNKSSATAEDGRLYERSTTLFTSAVRRIFSNR